MDLTTKSAALKAHSATTQIVMGVSAFLVVFYLIKFFLSRPERLNFPIFEASPSEYKSAVVEGSLKYPDTPFILGDVVVLPKSTLDEIRNLPEHQASFNKMVRKVMHSKYTNFGADHVELISAVKVDLTRHINSYLDGLQDELRYGLDKELGPCEDWTSVHLYYQLTRIVAFLSGRVFVGLPLSREEEWIDASINYTRDVMMAREAVEKQPAIMRPFFARFLPEVKCVKRYGNRCAVLLHP